MKVEHGIKAEEISNRIKWPFGQMKIDDSFFCEHPAAIVSVRAYNYGKKHHKKFMVRTVTENGVKGTRCWRIE